MVMFSRFEGADLERVKEIVSVFYRYGLGDIWEEFGLSNFGFSSKKIKKPLPVRTRLAMEDLGGAFVKFGQMLSTRRDMLPEEWVLEFEKLQDNVRPFGYRVAKREVEKSLGKKLGDVFSQFSVRSIASASIGQVYRARLKKGGNVAVKVMRPGIRRSVKRDLKIMGFVFDYLKEKEAVREMGLGVVFEEFSRSLLRELDYSVEARNIEKFYENFSNDEDIVTPKLFEDLCGERVLVMEFLRGEKINSFLKKRRSVELRKKLALVGVDSFFRQFFDFDFIHGDPHPGNVFVDKDKICFLDFGNCLHVTRRGKDVILRMVAACVKRDAEAVAGIIDEMSSGDDYDYDSLVRDVEEMFDLYYRDSLAKIEFGKLIESLIEMGFRYKLRIKGEYVSLMRVLIYIEDIGRRLYFDIDVIEVARPYVERLIDEKRSVDSVFGRFRKSVVDNYDLFERLPRELKSVFRKVKEGKIDVELRGKEIDELEAKISNTGNRIALSFVLAALLVSSTMIMGMDFEAWFWGMPVASVVGYFVSAVIGVRLFAGFLVSRFR